MNRFRCIVQSYECVEYGTLKSSLVIRNIGLIDIAPTILRSITVLLEVLRISYVIGKVCLRWKRQVRVSSGLSWPLYGSPRSILLPPD
jgi:hypothetical protein